MIVFKGDIVRTSSGQTGEVIETWGIARRWAKLKQPDGKLEFIFEADVTEIIKRVPSKSPRGRR